MLKIRKKYLLIAFLIFLIEVIIALFIKDNFIRPYLGDFLVVIMIYYFLKAFWQASNRIIATSVLLFAFLVEFLQYLNFIAIIGLEKSKLANIIIGNTFHWSDLLAYTLGILFIIFIDNQVNSMNK